MIKLNKKAIVALVLAVMTVMLCVVPVFGYELPANVMADSSQVDENVYKTGQTVLGYIQIIGTFIAVGVLMFLGIKYMTASANEKADVKKSIIPYIVGAIVLLLAVNIIPIIGTIGEKLFK